MMNLTIVLGGILALPALLVLVVTAPIVAILSVPALALFLFRKPAVCRKTLAAANARHAIITGGSSGIGLSIARDCVQRGFQRVTIVARNVERLEEAKKSLQELAKENKKDAKTTVTIEIQALSVDVSDPIALLKVAPKIFEKYDASEKNETTNTNKFATYLFCCAGTTYPEYFENVPAATFASIVNTNQLGVIYTVQAFLPRMQAGTIVLCSSICGQIGVFGYTSYAPSKFALRGFAECLHVELCNSPIHVQVAYPPDTDTEGFEIENKTKPNETRLISEQGGLAKPEDVAKVMVGKAILENPPFGVYFTFDAWMLTALTAGFGPVSSLLDAVSQIAGGPLFRFISLFYLQDWWDTIRRHQNEKQATAKATAKASDAVSKDYGAIKKEATSSGTENTNSKDE
jgi:3-dehydrosphinganine reductase